MSWAFPVLNSGFFLEIALVNENSLSTLLPKITELSLETRLLCYAVAISSWFNAL